MTESQGETVARPAKPRRRDTRDGIYRDPKMRNAKGEPAFIVSYYDLNGIRRRQRTEALSMGEARAIRAKKIEEINRAKALGFTSVEQLTPTLFSSYAAKYLENLRGSVSESTFRRYEDLNAILKAHFGNIALAAITQDKVEAFIKKRKHEKTGRGTPPGPAELNRERRLLGAIMESAVGRDLINRNPVRHVKPQKEPTKERIITPDEEKGLLEISPEWLRHFIAFGIYGGMREGEIAKVRWEDIQGSVIRIPNTKTGKPRNVPINSKMREVLDSLTKAVVDGQAVPWVFYNPKGFIPYKGTTISEAFSRMARKLNYEELTFHSTRHTFSTRMGAANVTEQKIMEVTGHSSSRMLKRYTHLAKQDLAGVTEVLCQPNVVALSYEKKA